MNSASPGVVSAFQPNKFYPTHEKYVEAIGAAMQEEYEAIVNSGLTLQLDCPDLASGWNNQYRHLTVPEFRSAIARHVELLNEAVRNIPAERMRLHLCWGNYEGPHNHDIPLAEIIDIVFKAKPAGISFEGANPRHAHEWKIFREIRLPPGKVLIPDCSEYDAVYTAAARINGDRASDIILHYAGAGRRPDRLFLLLSRKD